MVPRTRDRTEPLPLVLTASAMLGVCIVWVNGAAITVPEAIDRTRRGADRL